MKRTIASVFRPMALFIVAAGFSCLATSLMAQPVRHLDITQPGGFPGLPVLTGIERVTNGVSLTWDGPSGYYQLFRKGSLKDRTWTAVGGRTNLVRNAIVAVNPSNAFFRVAGPTPAYVGAQACSGCHDSIRATELKTPHAGTFTNALFVAAGGQTNTSCLPCHTVGYGLPTGFSSKSKTPQLGGVQCENCHGPAANHAANENDPTVRPRVELAATVCGGCHTGPMQPTYEEWNASAHAAVVPDALQVMSSSTNNISSCGRCHSGSVRLALINGKNPLALTNDLDVAITCAVCHNPHATNANPAQLRNPIASTNYFTLATTDVFTNKYNANTNINLCAQCHNSRGAAWTDSSRAPHRSLQYNFLLGSIGEFPDGPATFNPGAHAGLPDSARFANPPGSFYLTNQCVSCHMQSDAPPASTHSHTFAVDTHDVCLHCHLTEPGSSAVLISNNVSLVIQKLNRWAALRAPVALQTNGAIIWEYTAPGGLIWQTNSSGTVTNWTLADQVDFSGPDTAGQDLIPDNIKKARFNLYLVLNDGSFGAHNFAFAFNLLLTAESQADQ